MKRKDRKKGGEEAESLSGGRNEVQLNKRSRGVIR